MLINILFLLVTLACLGVIGFIVWSKMPQISNLDTQNLPQEKTNRKKNEIILRRLDVKSHETKQKLGQKLKPLENFWGKVQLKFRIYVGKIERLLHHEQMVKTKEEHSQLSNEELTTRLKSLIQEGTQYLEIGGFDRAEQSFIEAIKIDAKSADAYRGLAETYLRRGAREEAKQTFTFLHQLEPENDAVMVRLAQMAEEDDDVYQAIEYYQLAVVANDALSPRFAHLAELLLKVGQNDIAKEAIMQAVELEPQNPKYLDFLLETAILCQDKKLATEAFSKLRMSNPENSKLPEFKYRIDSL
ncbi:MAG: tetratricopeptide repeat protein [Candidatus Magasanikbacteria bacterium]|nr:tetratricopeptide repeat protein [Candidatus Magasanikbacteria bacterium]